MTTVQLGAYAEGLAQGRNESRALIEECLLAFEAIPTGKDSRKLLKKMGASPEAYAGDDRHILAQEMVQRLCKYLNRETP